MIDTILGTKIAQDQAWTQSGIRLPVTRIQAGPCRVTQIKTQETDGYTAVQLGLGDKKVTRISRPLMGHFKKSESKEKDNGATKTAPQFLREVRLETPAEGLSLGQEIKAEEVLKAGDMVDVTGTSQGKGFAGVVKRWGFKGGPKTHGQSDRHRAPGAIGQGTDPGRVHKGKHMAGRMGNETVTVRNLVVVKVDPETGEVWVKGLVPGVKNSLVRLVKVGQAKKFEALLAEEVHEN